MAKIKLKIGDKIIAEMDDKEALDYSITKQSRWWKETTQAACIHTESFEISYDYQRTLFSCNTCGYHQKGIPESIKDKYK